MSANENEYAETLLNIVLDEIDDIIIILDTDHTIVWINRAGANAFGVKADETIGTRCYKLFGRTSPCDDCDIQTEGNIATRSKRIKIIPKTGKEYVCTSSPLYRNGKIAMYVQHLSEVKDGLLK
jgi:PAS domain-containing protein